MLMGPRQNDDDVFKALADATRRRLLDALHAKNGQTLGSLCQDLAMSRQAVSQHLQRLEEANLVTTMKHGREKLHYINPVAIHAIYERWIETVKLVVRFPRDWLTGWRAVAGSIDRLIASLRPSRG